VRGALHALGRNLAAGLRLAFFMPVDAAAFRVSAAQLVLLVLVSVAIDVDADWLRAARDARFSVLGVHGELFALGLLALTAAVLAALRRDRTLYLWLPVVILASFPAIQVVHLLPDLPRQSAVVSGLTRDVFDAALFAWMLIVAMRAVFVCTDRAARHRRAFAVFGGIVVIAPIWFSPLVGPIEPWWRTYDAAAASNAMNPASEPVLAAQQFLMDRALDQLDDERRGVTDLYFVGFAPDARRPGFVSDVEAAQRAMDNRWHTSGRSLVLVNSPLTVAERPFATITNLREALLEIGDLVDPDDDVVMVYLTGSSAADHALTAANPPLELVNLSPPGLKQLLDAAGIRWRIVVVSTCAAGAWKDALSDDDTIVIASSAANVRGDDCAGSLVASRFGDAFFGQMGQSDDLQAAFDAAKKRLAALGAPTPVMWMGASIADHLKSLRAHQGRTLAEATAFAGSNATPIRLVARQRGTAAPTFRARTFSWHQGTRSLSIASARDSG
jgi:hypothetical protein